MMKKGIVVSILIAISSLVCSCGNSNDQPRVYDKSYQTDKEKYPVRQSVQPTQTIEDTPPMVEKKTYSSPPVKHSSPKHHYETKKTDNMRGFDPASEDDMDDNGMSRFMENNDDEGWD